MKKRSTNIYPKIFLEEVNEGFEYLYGKEQEKVTNKILLDHARMSQKKKTIQLNETFYQFRGYGIANMVLINTDEGFVLIDTLLTKELSEEAKKDFNRITGFSPLQNITTRQAFADFLYPQSPMKQRWPPKRHPKKQSLLLMPV